MRSGSALRVVRFSVAALRRGLRDKYWYARRISIAAIGVWVIDLLCIGRLILLREFREMGPTCLGLLTLAIALTGAVVMMTESQGPDET